MIRGWDGVGESTYDLYRHTLLLPGPCVVRVPDGRAWWIEVSNDTGTADDWFWYGGNESIWWPFDCCWYRTEYGTVADLWNAPAEQWTPAPWTGALAFTARLIHVGEASGLLVSKLPDDQLLLQWEPDCGGGGDYSI